MTGRRIAFVHLRENREGAPGYQQVVDMLNDSALATIDALGWDADVIAAGDVGEAATLARSRRAELILLMGGEDVHPSQYGGPTEYEGSGRHDPAGDAAQISLVHDAVERGTPLLAICRGIQVVNVALGGDLIQHLPNAVGHRLPAPHGSDTFLQHALAIEAVGSLGDSVVVTENVHSSHHQAINRLGAGLITAARSDDDVIEAVVHEHAAVTGVQWHPEHPTSPRDQFARLLRRLESQLG